MPYPNIYAEIEYNRSDRHSPRNGPHVSIVTLSHPYSQPPNLRPTSNPHPTPTPNLQTPDLPPNPLPQTNTKTNTHKERKRIIIVGLAESFSMHLAIMSDSTTKGEIVTPIFSAPVS